jgi:hypothetical protein
LRAGNLDEEDLKAFGLIDGSSDLEYGGEEGEEEQEDGGEANKK